MDQAVKEVNQVWRGHKLFGKDKVWKSEEGEAKNRC